jgi:hypothetical protein
MDARYVLPKSHATFYYARFNLKDLLMFIKQRQDLQIQPEVDNILAARIAYLVCDRIPELSKVINLDSVDMHYVKTARVENGDGTFSSKGTNLYLPEKKNDIFDWNRNDFIYQSTRDELRGIQNLTGENPFRKVWNKYRDLLEKIRSGVSK